MALAAICMYTDLYCRRIRGFDMNIDKYNVNYHEILADGEMSLSRWQSAGSIYALIEGNHLKGRVSIPGSYRLGLPR